MSFSRPEKKRGIWTLQLIIQNTGADLSDSSNGNEYQHWIKEDPIDTGRNETLITENIDSTSDVEEEMDMSDSECSEEEGGSTSGVLSLSTATEKVLEYSEFLSKNDIV